jgi:putative Mg2+ transporter-C (MgtC) family protein
VDWLEPSWIEALELGLLGRLLLATVLGGLIGVERELHGKPAGLRTNILICVGATLLMEVSRQMPGLGGTGDPGRIAAQVVSGIGFIGAGTILVERGSVTGLTTAATLWVVAAIGLAVGAGAYVEAVGTTALVMATLVVLGNVEEFVFRRRASGDVELVLDPENELLAQVVEVFRKHGLKVRPEQVEKQRDRFRASYRVRGGARARDAALQELMGLAGVRRVTAH